MSVRKWLMLLLAAMMAAFLFTGCAEDDDDDTPPAPTSPPVSGFDNELAVDWMTMAYDRIKANGTPPTKASRIYAYAALAMYEAAAPGMSTTHNSLAGQLNDFTGVPQPTSGEIYDWPCVINGAVAHVLEGLITDSTSVAQIEALHDEWVETRLAAVGAEIYTRSHTLAHEIAEAILDYAGTDGYSASQPPTCTYTLSGAPGAWTYTPNLSGVFATTPPLDPCWGTLRTFVLSRTGSDLECPPGAAPAFSTDPGSQLYAEAMEVFNTVNAANPEWQAIARWWSDDPTATGTPAGHWIRLAGQLLTEQTRALDVAVECYARLCLGQADAFISCWKTKYELNGMRPVTYIRWYIQTAPDTTWNSYRNTPRFPTCTSGHSTQSGAAAEALSTIFGENFSFTDHSNEFLGDLPRSFASFDAAADEAALSRLYGGIHFRSDNELGAAAGHCIGNAVNQVAFRK